MADESGLARLFPGLLNLLTENMDVLRNTVALMESYMLLAGEEIMQVSSINRVLDHLNDADETD